MVKKKTTKKETAKDRTAKKGTPKKEQEEEIPPKLPGEDGEHIVLTEATCQWKYSTTFRFTPQKVRAVTPHSINKPKVCSPAPFVYGY